MANVTTYWDAPGAEIAVMTEGFIDHATGERFVAGLAALALEGGQISLIGLQSGPMPLSGEDVRIIAVGGGSRWDREEVTIERYSERVGGRATACLAHWRCD